ncbi:D-hexose-6-phosphate mutarotase [Denitrificimonas sp. JX-1]|uniref:Putative glucose-6-phosphate 1-epimerase n=1 Tax=Denitrificimonas halotolerans TaxID=3098930 RepID=A0ABU5GV86_9GAMM|nr:D-hexose-6-phosphate mutarotase [Denitrificimonas sp. JX-1]MDY7220201.1 D-hexose-6-phosphate mutarotase [Denitrificimonas sp. JX-1]
MQQSISAMNFSGLQGWRLRFGSAQLDVCQQGGQILSYFPDIEQPPVIWLSDCAEYVTRQSVRGGVPVCWPWFGDLQRNPLEVQKNITGAAPFHGLARTLDWQLQQQRVDETGVQLILQLDASHGLAGWPHAAYLTLHIVLNERLSIRLENHNVGTQPLAISQALHSYFAVSDIRQVQVNGLSGCTYYETLEQWQLRQQQGVLTLNGETDRVYVQVPQHLQIIDPGWQRRIHLCSQGSSSAIVWNPWIAKAKDLSGFAEDAWQHMLCIESANVLEDHLLLAPGERHCLELQLSTD